MELLVNIILFIIAGFISLKVVQYIFCIGMFLVDSISWPDGRPGKPPP